MTESSDCTPYKAITFVACIHTKTIPLADVRRTCSSGLVGPCQSCAYKKTLPVKSTSTGPFSGSIIQRKAILAHLVPGTSTRSDLAYYRCLLGPRPVFLSVFARKQSRRGADYWPTLSPQPLRTADFYLLTLPPSDKIRYPRVICAYKNAQMCVA